MRVYFDSCAFIEAFETSNVVAPILLQFLDWLGRDEPRVVTSELTVAEIIDKPLRDGNTRLHTFYEGFLQSSSSLEVVPVSRSILLRAAELRASRLCAKLPDAIHVATAAEAGCAAFVTDDDRMRVPPPMLKVGYIEQDLLKFLSSSA